MWNLPQWTRLTRLKIRDTDVLIHDVLHNLRQLQDLEATMHPPDPANGSAMRELVVPEIKQLQHLTGKSALPTPKPPQQIMALLSVHCGVL